MALDSSGGLLLSFRPLACSSRSLVSRFLAVISKVLLRELYLLNVGGAFHWWDGSFVFAFLKLISTC